MPSITVKSIPDELYERIKQSAAEHRRSINKEVIICLERTLLARRVNPAAFLARADALREQSDLPPLTDEILRKAKAEGRPWSSAIRTWSPNCLLAVKRHRGLDLFSNETRNGGRPYCGEANFEAYWRCISGKENYHQRKQWNSWMRRKHWCKAKNIK